jgi:hypothetical protein
MQKEQITCPNCKRVLSKFNAYHYCKAIEIDDLFLNKPDEVILIFDKLLQAIEQLENVAMSGTKNCVVFVRNKTFLVAKPMRTCLEIKFYSTDIIDDEELYKCHLWNSKYEGIIRPKSEFELKPKFIQYIKDSYKIS